MTFDKPLLAAALLLSGAGIAVAQTTSPAQPGVVSNVAAGAA